MSVAQENYEKVKLQDFLEAVNVEFEISSDNKVWLNIEGKCAIRIGRADNVIINDRREFK